MISRIGTERNKTLEVEKLAKLDDGHNLQIQTAELRSEHSDTKEPSDVFTVNSLIHGGRIMIDF